MADEIARAGYDYFEWGVGPYLKPGEGRPAFEASLLQARKAALPCPVVNGFIPAELKIVGPAVDRAALERYVVAACERAEESGVEIIVFGSGGARRVPDGFDRAKAHDQLVSFCRRLGAIAADHRVTIAIEPLNRGECNILTTVRECAELVSETDRPAVRLHVDAYHLMKDGDSLEDVKTYGGLLAHAHIATVPSRLPPGAEPCDLGGFFRALADGGYGGRVSIEGNISKPDRDFPGALSLMKGLKKEAR